VTGDDDIAASIPKAPPPAPARREAAISEALRRFDGVEAKPERAGGERRPAWWRRPQAGALAGAFLVAIIGLPFVWTAFDNAVVPERRPPAQAPAPAPAPGPTADVAPTQAPPPPAPTATAERPASEQAEPAEAPVGAAADAAEAAGRQEAAKESSAEEGGSSIVVTGSRIRRPNLSSSVPVTSIGSEELAARDRRAERAARRGDWNACTIEDPGRSLERCEASVATVARGARGPAKEPLADGLSSAWNGDLEEATAAFDRAIELSPRSSSAWLNRGLAWRSRGDLDRALADLDRAVLYAPNDARAYYHRALVHRERGDLRRARADEERAVQLDPRYAPLVRSR